MMRTGALLGLVVVGCAAAATPPPPDTPPSHTVLSAQERAAAEQRMRRHTETDEESEPTENPSMSRIARETDREEERDKAEKKAAETIASDNARTADCAHDRAKRFADRDPKPENTNAWIRVHCKSQRMIAHPSRDLQTYDGKIVTETIDVPMVTQECPADTPADVVKAGKLRRVDGVLTRTVGDYPEERASRKRRDEVCKVYDQRAAEAGEPTR